MLKREIVLMPKFFDRYINLVEEENIYKALQLSKQDLQEVDFSLLQKIGNKTYQKGKWTINDIFQHILDTERIMAYRALRIARNDKTPLAGFDEALFGNNSMAENRKLETILEELITVRTSTIQLFDSFNKSVLSNTTICAEQNISALALGFVIVGHQMHHLQVIKEKYQPLSTII